MTGWIKLQKHAQHLQDQTNSAEWPSIQFHTTLFVSLLTFPLTFFFRHVSVAITFLFFLEPHIMLTQRCADCLSFCVESAVESIGRSREQIFFHLQISAIFIRLFVCVCARVSFCLICKIVDFDLVDSLITFECFFWPFFFAFTVQIQHRSVSEQQNFLWNSH